MHKRLLVVGERINTSRKRIAEAVQARDREYLQGQAKEQAGAGAVMIDVNAGTFVQEEPEVLTWLVKLVQDAVDLPLCIDSPNPEAIEAALKVHRGKALVNSVTGERKRFEQIVPAIKQYGCSVVALCLDDAGMPSTSQEAVDKGSRLIENLIGEGIPAADIYVDPLVRPVSTDQSAGSNVMKTLSAIKQQFPVSTICGLSNVSYGLPCRKLLNQAFLVTCMAAGLEAVILDPLDSRLMALLHATRVLLGHDQYCTEYLHAFREGRLEAQ